MLLVTIQTGIFLQQVIKPANSLKSQFIHSQNKKGDTNYETKQIS